MVILCVALPDLAVEVSRLISGARYIVKVFDGKDLRHQVHEHQPDILLLDWRLGGSLWRAIDEVPAIVERTISRPSVIVMLPHTTLRVEQEAAERDCYDAISVSDVDFPSCLRRSVDEAERARHVHPPIRRRVARAALH